MRVAVIKLTCGIFISLALFACAEHVPAPVINLSSNSYQPPPAPDEDLSLPEYHEVKPGDTLFSIAFNYGLDYRELAEINGIEDGYRIYPGQKLRFAAQQIPYRNETFNAKKLQVAVHKALGLPIQAPDEAESSKNTSEKVSVRSPQKPDVIAKPKVNNKKRLKSTRQSVAKSVKGQSTLSKVNRWYWPVKGPILSGFSKKLHGNKGVDISGKPGQPVRAAAPGRVVYRGNSLKGYGNLIIVKHNDDYLSAYAHNSKIHVRENEIVKAGQVIADIGNTGADESKLHFEIRYQGKPVDPTKFLPKL